MTLINPSACGEINFTKIACNFKRTILPVRVLKYNDSIRREQKICRQNKCDINNDSILGEEVSVTKFYSNIAI